MLAWMREKRSYKLTIGLTQEPKNLVRESKCVMYELRRAKILYKWAELALIHALAWFFIL
jgi:hypothetical protein